MRCLNIFNISVFSEMDEIGSSTLVTRMTSDVNQAQAGVNLVLRLFYVRLLLYSAQWQCLLW